MTKNIRLLGLFSICLIFGHFSGKAQSVSQSDSPDHTGDGKCPAQYRTGPDYG